MVNSGSYIPKQPFFELSTTDYKSCIAAASGLLAQYYNFVVSSSPEHSLVAVPDGTIDIVFHLDDSRPRAYVCGSVKKGKTMAFGRNKEYFGVRFYPSAAEQLLECPLDEFTDQEIPLEDIQPQARNLAEFICQAETFEQRMRLFDQYQASFNEQENPVPMIVSYILEQIHLTNGEIRIQELESRTGYTSRHIDNIFKRHVGITPKLYTRIVRFQRIFDRVQSRNHLDFTCLAEDAGYYDQAHFINEFKSFSMSTPSQVFCA